MSRNLGDAGSMSSEGSVTRWIEALQAGDSAAAQQLWERYFRRLVDLARKKLQARGAAPPMRKTWP